MASNTKELSIDVDMRKAMHSMTVRVQVKRMLWVRIGLVFIRIGCWLSGAQFVEEFPLSLMQDGKEVEME